MAVHFLATTQDQDLIGKADLAIIADTYAAVLPDGFVYVELECVASDKMRAINATYRAKDESTDVLSFPTVGSYDEIMAASTEEPLLLGSILVCPETAGKYGETLPQLVHHGFLHLLGFDHETDLASWKTQEALMLDHLAEAGIRIASMTYE
jgi:probable rRNA maturation factor